MSDEKPEVSNLTVDQVLVAIRRIISDDERGRDIPQDEQILDLTDRIDGPEAAPPPATGSGTGAETRLEADPQAAEVRAAMDKIARVLGERPKNVPLPTGEALEDAVRDALKPMLQDWLDQILPQMVETLVREEVRKLVKRSAD